MPNLLLVMLVGAIGAGLRYGVGLAAVRRLGAGFPWGTLLVNLAGGLGAGLLLGGFTTFSAFSAETAYMLQRGDFGLAGLYTLVSVAGALALLFAGLWLARAAT